MRRETSLLAFCVVLAGACRCGTRPIPTDLSGGEILPLRLAPGAPAVPFGPPVSLCRVAPGVYLVANYSALFVFDRPAATLSPIELASPKPHASIGAWNPTGLACFESSHRVYIANYESNDVLQARFSGPPFRLELEQVISSPDLRGPENVALTPGEDVLVTANFTGSSFTCFERRTDRWIPRWTVPADRAHGVAIADGFAYGTSLGERRAYRIQLANGKVDRTAGKLGWGVDDYLWPTTVQATPNGRILVADAHLGRIRELDPETLRARRFLGTNGPGLSHLNMPYGLLAGVDEVGVLSTFQNRILFLDAQLASVRSQFLWGGDWGLARSVLARRDRSLGTGWEGYTQVDGPPVSVWGRPYRASFGYLHLPDASAQAHSLHLSAAGPNLLDTYRLQLFFIQSAPVRGGALVFSPQTTRAMYLLVEAGHPYLVPVDVELDSWVVDGEIWGPSGRLDTDALAALGEKRVTAVERGRGKNGLLGVAALAQAFERTDVPAGDVSPLFDRHFPTAPGKAFLREYRRCEAQGCEADGVKRIARSYWEAAIGEKEVVLDELALVQMLTGVRLVPAS